MTARVPFTVEVEGIGQFTFRHAAFVDQLRIEARALRILGGESDNQDLRSLALMVARLEVLTEEAPATWSLADLDPDDDDVIPRLVLVHRRLLDEQKRFRAAAQAGRVPSGEAGKPDAGVPVPAALPAGAD